MTADEIKNMLSSLQHLMYGCNYQVSFGINIVEDCKTLDDFFRQLKLTYKEIQPEKTKPISLTEADLWEEIDFGLKFHGDDAAGLTLSPEKEELLKVEQTKYKSFAQQFLSQKTNIYSYPDDERMPFYVVYWGFAFILLNQDDPSLFVFGGASD